MNAYLNHLYKKGLFLKYHFLYSFQYFHKKNNLLYINDKNLYIYKYIVTKDKYQNIIETIYVLGGAIVYEDAINFKNFNKFYITRIFKYLQKTIDERAKILADYNGDYNFYLQKGGKPMPIIVLIVIFCMIKYF